MSDSDIRDRIERLKAVKSAFILEAQSMADRGLLPLSMSLYESAADAELSLARLFESLNRQEDARISLFSAASCLVQARQYQKALPILEGVREAFPEAEQMILDCRDKEDEPILAGGPELRALISLLLKKGLITEAEWAKALDAASAS
jgi:hypothetical protein